MRISEVLSLLTKRLVARGLWRPALGTSRQAFQLHPNGYTFQPGSVPRLELLPKDAGPTTLNTYGRAANGQGDITVANLEFRIPVTQKPGANGGGVKVPRDEFVPPGRTLMPDFVGLNSGANATIADGKLKLSGNTLSVNLGSPAAWVACHAKVEIYSGNPPASTASGKLASAAGKKGKGKKKGKKKKKKKKKKRPTGSALIGTGTATIAGGQTGEVKVTLNAAGQQLAKQGGSPNLVVRVKTDEQDGTVQATRQADLGKKKAKKKKKKKKKGKGKKKK